MRGASVSECGLASKRFGDRAALTFENLVLSGATRGLLEHGDLSGNHAFEVTFRDFSLPLLDHVSNDLSITSFHQKVSLNDFMIDISFLE
jgi:hypothetical protein